VPQTIGKAVDPIYEAIGEKRWKLDDEWEKWEQQVQKEEHFSEGTINIALNEARNWLDNDFAPNMRSLEVRVREILGVNEY